MIYVAKQAASQTAKTIKSACIDMQASYASRSMGHHLTALSNRDSGRYVSHVNTVCLQCIIASVFVLQDHDWGLQICSCCKRDRPALFGHVASRSAWRCSRLAEGSEGLHAQRTASFAFRRDGFLLETMVNTPSLTSRARTDVQIHTCYGNGRQQLPSKRVLWESSAARAEPTQLDARGALYL